MTLGERLKEYRERERLTQEQLAERLNVSRQAITKWENDKGLPDVENLVMISRMMGVSLDELVFGRTGENTAAPAVPSGLGQAKGASPGPGGRPAEPPAVLARQYAFAALGFLVGAVCFGIAGCINLATGRGAYAPLLPLLNFGTAALSLWAAAVQARKCARARRNGENK